MKKKCAWCGGGLGRVLNVPGSEHVTHGICDNCRTRLLDGFGTPLHEFVETLSVPVLIVQDDTVVEAANDVARKALGKNAAEIRGRLPGDVFECMHTGPDGCGRSVHCSGCVIRSTVTNTYQTGMPHCRVPATLKREMGDGDGTGEIAFYVTTERVGGRVLLRIDPVE